MTAPLGHRRAEFSTPSRLASPHRADCLGNRYARTRLVGLLRDFHDAYRDSASPRCAKCGWLILQPHEGVRVMRRRNRCHLDNVMRCGLMWECPSCGAHVKAERAHDAEKVRAWHIADRIATLGATGWSTEHKRQWAETTSLMWTFTVRHGAGNELRPLRAALAKAYQRFSQSTWAKEKERIGIVGTVRALEVTWGDANGYHPHLHTAAFLRAPLPGVPLEADCEATPNETRHAVFVRWRSAVVAVLGEDFAPLEYGLDGKPVGVVFTRCDRARYLSKLGLEIAAPQTKQAREGHYTPLDFLAEFTESGDVLWLHRYQEYAAAMRGARQLTWSRGLKLSAGLVERTDEEIVAGEEEPGDELITVIPTAAFNIVRSVSGAVASLLELSELYGRRAADRFVAGILRDYTAAVRAQLERRGLYAAPPALQ